MTSESGDLRDILQMRSAAAWFIVAVYSIANILMAVCNPEGVEHVWVVAAAAVLMSSAVVRLIVAPGDPIHLRYALPIAVVPPLAVWMVLWQLPIPVHSLQQLWPFAAAVCVVVFLCIRGSIWSAWLSLTAIAIVCAQWTAATGRGPILGIAMAATNFAPLVMATVFAFTVRPTARSIIALREQNNLRAASEAAAVAVLEERDQQLDRLDTIARPLLEIIASGRLLTDDEQESCRLLEAELRDRLRGGVIVDDVVARAANDARGRDVNVLLLDDGGLDESSTGLRDVVRSCVATTLDATRTGSVSARVLPPGRSNIATILVSDGDTDRRVEISTDGTVRSDLAEIAPL